MLIARTRRKIRVSQGVEFFAFLREMTADGFFTSEIGIKYLGYVGNTICSAFRDAPPYRKRKFVILTESKEAPIT